MNAVSRRLRRLAPTVVLSFALASLPVTGAVAAPATTECATPMTVAQLQALLDAAGTDPETGEQNPVDADGLTVVKGTMPQAFTAKILGIDYGGIGIDHDLIVAELSGLGIDTNRGVWAGMSGSPVYVGDQLIGAVSYGFTWGPSALAGITPAEEMMMMTSGGMTSASSPDAMTLSVSQRMSVAAQTEQSVTTIPARVPRMQVPLALNGVTSERLQWLQEQAVADRARVNPVAGSGYSAAAAGPADITPGSNFAAALSYGDITAAGTGTTTWTCGTEALAFGHPFFWSGRTAFGLHSARSLAIATDAAAGSYKLAVLGSPVGLVDQDRYTGLHGTLNGAPPSTRISSLTLAEQPDGSFDVDEGTTNVTYADYVPFVTFLHGFSNIDFLLDRYFSRGSSEVTWTVDMTHAGRTYRLQRTNKFSSPFDISIESMMEPWMQLEQLAGNRFGPVHFDAVALRAQAVDTERHFAVRRLQVRRDGEWVTPKGRLRVAPRQTLRVRTVLHRYEGSAHVDTRKEVSWFTIPRRAGGSYGAIVAGQMYGGEEEGMFEESTGDEFCFITGECGGSETSVKTFGELVNTLADAPRNDELTTTMSLYGQRGKWTRQHTAMVSKSVVGSAVIGLRVVSTN